jgi:tetratricopeptide (TPR) repeat protein/5-methylcytosine-specific restriction endonuclease McrA
MIRQFPSWHFPRLVLPPSVLPLFPALLALLLLAACTPSDSTTASADTPLTIAALTTPSAPKPEEFAGAESCASCHATEYASWRRSTHGTAGGVPGSSTNGVKVIAPFDGTPMRFADATVRPRQRGGRYEFLVQRPGEADTAYSVTGVIGGGHMVGGGTQGFVTDWPDGTVRFLPFDWSKDRSSWFCNTGTRANKGWQPISAAMRLADCGDWPPMRVLGDEPRFSNCQSCHGSNITLQYDESKRQWRTDIATYAVNCESCHGPAARHVKLMQQGSTGADIGLEALATLDKDRSVGTCMGCHALKTRLATGYVPGAQLTQFYSVALSQLGDKPFTPDGRTRTFAYQEGHYASDCYRNGGMTCASCHDPHTQGYRTADGEPLPGRVDDRQCTSCHASKRDDVQRHTKHAPGSRGSNCVSCHMPYEQQHELGRAITYGRSDHTIAIPRPVVDSSLGLVGSCKSCHADRSVSQLAQQATTWWGTIKPHEPAVAGLFAARTEGSAERAAPLLLQPSSRHAMAQVAGLAEWLERFATPRMESTPGDFEQRLLQLADSRDVDVQALALATLHFTRGHVPAVRRALVARLEQVPGGAARDAVRRRWATVLGGLGDAAREAGNARQAVTAYRAALEVTPNAAPLLLNLGLSHAAAGDLPAAVSAYRQSLQADPRQPMGEVNLGIALELGGDADGALAAYDRALQADPTAALPYLNIGTLFLRSQRAAEARPWLEKALARDPGLATGHFQLALVFVQSGALPQAEASVRRSLALDPANAEAVKLLEALREAQDK